MMERERPMAKSLMQFDHVGIPTTETKPGMTFVPATRVWITEAHDHPYRVEWLRYEPDSPVTGPLHDQPHVGFRVRKVEQIAEEQALLKKKGLDLDPARAARLLVKETGEEDDEGAGKGKQSQGGAKS